MRFDGIAGPGNTLCNCSPRSVLSYTGALWRQLIDQGLIFLFDVVSCAIPCVLVTYRTLVRQARSAVQEQRIFVAYCQVFCVYWQRRFHLLSALCGILYDDDRRAACDALNG